MLQLVLSFVFGNENLGVDVFKHLGPKDLVRFGCVSPRCRDLALGVLQNTAYVESFRGFPHLYKQLFLAAVSLPKSKENKYAALKKVASMVSQIIGVRFRESQAAPLAYLHPVLREMFKMHVCAREHNLQFSKTAEKCGLYDLTDEILFRGFDMSLVIALALPYLLKTRGCDFVYAELMRCQNYSEVFRVIAEAFRLGENTFGEELFLECQEDGRVYNQIESYDAMALMQFGSEAIQNYVLENGRLTHHAGLFAMLGASLSGNDALANQIEEANESTWNEWVFLNFFCNLYREKQFELAECIYSTFPSDVREVIASDLLGIAIKKRRWEFAKKIAGERLLQPRLERGNSKNLSMLFRELLVRGDARFVAELLDSTQVNPMNNLDLVEVYKKALTDKHVNREVIDSINGHVRGLASNLVFPYVRELILAGADELLEELLPNVQLNIHHKYEAALLAIKKRQDLCLFALVNYLAHQMKSPDCRDVNRLIGLCLDIGLALIQSGREDLFAELVERFHPPLHLLDGEDFDDFFDVASPDLIRAVMAAAIDEESLKKIGTPYQVIKLHKRGFHDLASEYYERIKGYLSLKEIRKLNNFEIRKRGL